MLTSCPFYGGSREIGVAAGAANLRGRGAEGTNYGVTVIKLLSTADVSSVLLLGCALRRTIQIGLGKICPRKFAFVCGRDVHFQFQRKMTAAAAAAAADGLNDAAESLLARKVNFDAAVGGGDRFPFSLFKRILPAKSKHFLYV